MWLILFEINIITFPFRSLHIRMEEEHIVMMLRTLLKALTFLVNTMGLVLRVCMKE